MNLENSNTTVRLLKQALGYHQSGYLNKAWALYENVMAMEPDNAEALHLSGLIAQQQGKKSRAIRRIRRAAELKPQSTTYLKNLCTVLNASGFIAETVQYYQKLVTLNPQDCDSWFRLGNTYQQLGRFDESIQAYIQLIQIEPNHFGALHNLGAAYYAQGDNEKAVACFKSALKIEPESEQVYFSLSNAHFAAGAFNEAIEALQRAIQIEPNYIEARFNLANLYKETGSYQTAIENYVKLLKLDPNMSEAHNNLGNVFYHLNQVEHALQCYEAALKIKRDYPEALHNTSLVLQDQGQYEEAIRLCRKAVALNREYEAGYASMVHQMRQACSWKDLDPFDRQLDHFTDKALSENRRPAEDPFLNISRHADPPKNLAVASAWSREISQRVQSTRLSRKCNYTSYQPKLSQQRRLRVGYLSNNFRNHPTAHLLSRLFGLHDRNKFRIHAYSYGPSDSSEYRRRIEQDCDRFVDIRDVSDEKAVHLIGADEIDILVDLVGFMKGHRLGICARRPAPIQARYLGMAGTSGADFFDYIIVDRTVVPEAHACFYSERLVYMPYCYQINDDHQPITEVNYTKADFGLPENSFVYCSFASHYKLDPVMFATWMRVLKQVEPSVLWLTPGSDIAAAKLRAYAESLNIESSRLVFADRMPKEHHLARLGLADLALDTRIVGGAATTSDALWAGIPVITLKGKHFASRMSASLLSAMGLEELITREISEYESLAVQIGRDHQKLKTLKERLCQQVTAGNLFKTETAVRHLERAYGLMWENFINGHRSSILKLQ